MICSTPTHKENTVEPLIQRKARNLNRNKSKRSDLDHHMARKAAAKARLSRQNRFQDDEEDIRHYLR